MRQLLVVLFVSTLLAGCKDNSVTLNTAATVAYDKARDGEPKDIGPSKGGKGKKGGGAGAPP
jgi:uncharacterized protein YceK